MLFNFNTFGSIRTVLCLDGNLTLGSNNGHHYSFQMVIKWFGLLFLAIYLQFLNWYKKLFWGIIYVFGGSMTFVSTEKINGFSFFDRTVFIVTHLWMNSFIPFVYVGIWNLYKKFTLDFFNELKLVQVDVGNMNS